MYVYLIYQTTFEFLKNDCGVLNKKIQQLLLQPID